MPERRNLSPNDTMTSARRARSLSCGHAAISRRRALPDLAALEESVSRRPETVLAVGAHPDDIDATAGGSLALWARGGSRVCYCVVTDGGAGGSDPSVGREDMCRLRRAEQVAAAQDIGAEEVVFLGFSDGDLNVTTELRQELARVIRRFRPDRVVCQSPERLWYGPVQTDHPDHLAVGEAVLCAVYPDARNLVAHPDLRRDGLAPHHVTDVWVVGAEQVDVVVDITDAIDQKVAAFKRHSSQLPDGPVVAQQQVLAAAEHVARLHGLGRGRFGEEFGVRVTRERHSASPVQHPRLGSEVT